MRFANGAGELWLPRSRFRACRKICCQEGTKGAPFHEQKCAAKQREASKMRFANGASELWLPRRTPVRASCFFAAAQVY